MGVLKSIYFRTAERRPGFHRRAYPWLVFARSLWLDTKAMPRQLLQVDLIRALVCLPRYLIGFLLLRRYRAIEGGDGVSANTLAHNIRGSGELSAPRSHLLIRPIVTLDRIARDIRNLGVLTIGPRVEGEIYNLMAYGFRGSNIRGLDLFSYSPYVDVGDMHAMPYPDDSFDIVLSGWVLGYSDRKQLCVDEMKRVCRPGGIIAIGNGSYLWTPEEAEKAGGIRHGSAERVPDLAFLEALCRPKPENIVFRYDGSRDGVNGAPLILIYQAA
jgi:SAM-dependent methyltransferase